MNCHDCFTHQDDYLDNQLNHDLHEAVTKHLATCSDCMVMIQKNRELLQRLRNIETPPPSPGFLKLAMENASRIEDQRLQKKWWIQFASIAAMLCVVVLGALHYSPWLTTNTSQQSGIVFSLHESKEIILLVQSAKNMENATITIELPPQLMLAQSPETRKFSWQADFKTGKNLIPLPLVASTAGTMQVTARIEYQNQVKTIHTQVQILPNV